MRAGLFQPPVPSSSAGRRGRTLDRAGCRHAPGLLSWGLGLGLLLNPQAGPAAADASAWAPLVEANTAFALRVYGGLRSAEGNLLVAPYSLAAALAMTAAGAEGETAAQIGRVLHGDTTLSNLPSLFGQLNDRLHPQAPATEAAATVALSLWPQQGAPLRGNYVDLVRTRFGGTVTPLDYAADPDKARLAINAGVDGQTGHTFQELIPAGVLTSRTRMLLVSLQCLKGRWLVPFPEAATQPAFFRLPSRGMVQVPFMHLRCTLPYGEDVNGQWVVLPYRGGRFEMLLLLPRTPDGFHTLEANLTVGRVASALWQAHPRLVETSLPKFALSNVMVFPNHPESSGMPEAYAPDRADFSGLGGTPHLLYLTAILHGARVQVDEWGSDVAPATPVRLFTPAAETAAVFRADRPFLFLIRETSTGSILLLGRVAEPRSG